MDCPPYGRFVAPCTSTSECVVDLYSGVTQQQDSVGVTVLAMVPIANTNTVSVTVVPMAPVILRLFIQICDEFSAVCPPSRSNGCFGNVTSAQHTAQTTALATERATTQVVFALVLRITRIPAIQLAVLFTMPARITFARGMVIASTPLVSANATPVSTGTYVSTRSALQTVWSMDRVTRQPGNVCASHIGLEFLAWKPTVNSCPGNCFGTHGYCDKLTGQCTCYQPFLAPNCHLTGVCACNSSFAGKGCQIANFTCHPSCINGNCYSLHASTSNALGKLLVLETVYATTPLVFVTAPPTSQEFHVTSQTVCANNTRPIAASQIRLHIDKCPNNCSGTHGHCDPNKGQCICYSPWTLPDCLEGSCQLNCSYPHGVCNTSTAVCTCAQNYIGKSCQIANFTCHPACLNGTCNTLVGKCICNGGYWGDICQYKTCPTNCQIHGVCNNFTGICHCSQNWTGANCMEANYSCPKNCYGSRGHCDATSGKCSCYSPWTLPACEFATCTLNCSYPNGVCNIHTGVCKCEPDWTGKGCQILNLTCSPPCINGACDSGTGKCVCQAGYFGDTCLYKQCGGKTPCSSHGICNNLTGTCSCDPHYDGNYCEIPDFPCPNNCTSASRGSCNTQTGQCLCRYPYYGTNCSLMKCPNNCRGHGICNSTNGVCICNSPYLPPDCYFMSCPLNCSGHGTCNPFTGKCTCKPSTEWTGLNCSIRECPNSCSNAGKCNQATGKCNCHTGAKGSDCSGENWWIIVVCAGGGTALVVGGATAGFVAVRQMRINNARSRRAKNSASYVDMDPLSASGGAGTH
ncbi:tenascin X [Pelomyxa schiedti]|nr:tenascin X [Pelomyxa schiedti]